MGGPGDNPELGSSVAAPEKAGFCLGKGTGSRGSLRATLDLRREGRRSTVMKSGSSRRAGKVRSQSRKDTVGCGTDGKEVKLGSTRL